MHCFWGHKEGETLSLHPDELVHAVKVLRIAPSDIIHVFDGNGDTYIGRVTQVHKKYVHALCVETRKAYGAVTGFLHVAISPTKNIDRMHFFLEKACELGIHAMTPLLSFHSERRNWNAERAERVLRAACTQSQKGTMPALHAPQKFGEFLQELPKGAKGYIATCIPEEREDLVAALRQSPDVPTFIMIGPEGDFSPEELTLAKNAGWKHVHLGYHRLRTETAGLYAVAAFAQR